MGESVQRFVCPPPWYVVIREDNGYPVLIYEKRETAELVARKNSSGDLSYRVVAVVAK